LALMSPRNSLRGTPINRIYSPAGWCRRLIFRERG
jgi:hypothetical protein